MNKQDMSPNTKHEKTVQFYDRVSQSKSIPIQSLSTRYHVGRSNSAITPKISSSKLRRHAKSEPISSNKESISTTNISPTKSDSSFLREKPRKPPISSQSHHHQKRPTTLPIKSYVNTTHVPSATSSADLPGENTKVSGLIDENKRLRYRILQLEKRESQFTADLDKLQMEYKDMTETNERRFKIEERRMAAMEFAMQQLAMENDKLKQESQTKSEENHVKRESPIVEQSNGITWQSPSSTSPKPNVAPTTPNQGDLRAAFDSVNFLLNALREKDNEFNMLKMHCLKVEQNKIRQKQMAQQILSPTNPMFTFPEYLTNEIPLQSYSEPNLLPSGVITPPADFHPVPPLSHLNEYHTPILTKESENFAESEPSHEYK